MNFWDRLESLIKDSRIVIDRPKGSSHPKFERFIFPLDYGYLSNTVSNDRNEIDVWKGSLNSNELTGIVCTVDSMKRDSEVKILIGCDSDDIRLLTTFYKNNAYMSGMITLNPSSTLKNS
jgi:inorganic pyrophosphatase